MLRTTVIGSYPFPGWLEFAAANLHEFGPADIAEAQDDAVIAALHDQRAAGLDVVTDGVAVPMLHAAGYAVLSEESGRTGPTTGAGVVVMDPLDGSTNARSASRSERGR